MTWIAILTGLAAFAALSVLSGPARRRTADAGSLALQAIGATGLLSLAAAALMGGRVVAALLAGVAGVALVVDPRAAAGAASRRWARPRGSIVPSLRNAMQRR